MKIDGRLIADGIKNQLKKNIAALKSKSISPHLAVILIGSNPSSSAYVRQKQKTGSEIGAKVTLFQPSRIDELHKLIKKLNSDFSIHGVIIQRPVPFDIPAEQLNLLVDPEKDIDGFHPESPFNPPIAGALIKILEFAYRIKYGQLEQLVKILQKKSILIIGRGETGGKPIADTFKKLHIPFQVAHSKTANLHELTLASDIIISAVGKSDIVRRSMVTEKTVLIGVGLHPEDSKLDADYNQEEIADKVAFYTPVPGGVGPVNVACLFENLVLAANRLLKLSSK